jgi:hypothetical protein
MKYLLFTLNFNLNVCCHISCPFNKGFVRLDPGHRIRKPTRRVAHTHEIPAYTHEIAAAMFLGSIVREFYYKQYGENCTMITKTAPFGI